MRGEPVELNCPFCDKGRIEAWYIPGAWGEKVAKTGSLPGSKKVQRSADIWLIKSGCSLCGKSQEEVEKELKRKNAI